jgi:hypothetical protein
MTIKYFFIERPSIPTGSGPSSWTAAYTPPLEFVGRLVRWQHRRDRWYTADKSLARDPADAADAEAVARDDGGLPRLGTACRRGIIRGNVGGCGGARDRMGGGLVGLSDSIGTNRRGG